MPRTEVLDLKDAAPLDGRFPDKVADRISAAHDAGQDRTFSLYVHIPFCEVRCGYCDFNTYISPDLGPGASRDTYADTVLRELEFAAQAMDASGIPPRSLHSVFFGGGTPTLLPSGDLVRILDKARSLWGITEGAEVTTEANPDSVTAESLAELKDGGFTRLSMGMQSAVPHVLQVLERTHRPENVPTAVGWAKDLGLEVSLDLIYGTPTESLEDWRTSLHAAIDHCPEHISAYGLIVEEGTKLAAQIRRGQRDDTDPDDQADKYLMAEEILSGAGYRWYEISNWAHDPEGTGVHRAEHNVAYWRNQDWWGAGPGAHSHMAGVRFWNAKHPAAYAQRVSTGVSPAIGREEPDEESTQLENIMLGVRLSDGLPLDTLDETAQAEARLMVVEGLIEPEPLEKDGRIVPTLKGRLLDDAITRRLAGF